MKALIILGVFGVCFGSPVEYSDSQHYQQPLAEERSSAYEPPQLQALDDKRYDSRYEAGEDVIQDYYYDAEEEDNLNSIPGDAGVNYPVLGAIPRTAFNCGEKLPGFYADIETDCQVWHYCKTDGLLESFLCPNGTIYNQKNRVCEWWFNVDCQDNVKFEKVNEDLYIVPEKDIQQYQVSEQRVYRQQQEQAKEYNRPEYQKDSGYKQ